MANTEALLVGYLAEMNPTAVVTTETDETLQDSPWTILIARAGGAKLFTIDRPRFVVDTFAIAANGLTARVNASNFADLVDGQMLRQLRGRLLDGHPVTWTGSVSGPSFVPDANTVLRHYAATYSVAIGD